MELFVSEHLTGQVRSMLGLESDDEDLNSAMDIYRTRIEQQQASGMQTARAERKRVLKPRPATWDSDFDGSWENEPDAWTYEDEQAETSSRASAPAPAPARKTARGRAKATQQDDDMDLMDEDEPLPAPAKKPAAKRATRATKAAPAKKVPAKGRGRKAFEDSEDEEEDVIMESEEEPAPPPPKTRRTAAKSTAKTPATRGAGKNTRQTKLNFSQSQKGGTQSKAVEISDDEISDDDAFEPAPATTRSTRRR